MNKKTAAYSREAKKSKRLSGKNNDAKQDKLYQLEHQELLASIVSSSEDAIIGKTLDGIITTWNKGAEVLYGYKEREVIGRPISILIAPDMQDEMPAILKRLARGGRVDHYETTRLRKDGATVDVSLTISPIRDGDTNIIGASTIARRLSRPRRSRSKALESGGLTRTQEEQLQLLESIISSSDDAIIGKTLDGTITSWNKGAEVLYGYTEKEMAGKPIQMIVAEDRQDEMPTILGRLARGDRVDHYETQRLRKDGSIIDISLTISPIKDSDGQIIGASTIARDITAQKQAAQYARSLIEASLDPLVTISPEGKVTDVNEASVKATGIPREKLIGTDFSDYFTEPGEARAGYQQVFAKGSVSDYPLTIRHKNGNLMDVLYNASVYRDTEGNVLGVFAAARDITAQKQAAQYARSLIEASLDPLVTISPEGKITDVNEASVKATGILREKLIGTVFSDYFTEPHNARAGYQQVFAKGTVSDYPLTIRRKDGNLMDVLYNASVYRDTGGQVLGVFAAARDITAQKQAAQYARSLIESSPDPLVTISPEGKVTDVNEASVKATGILREKLIGTDFSDYFTEPEKAREGYQQVFAEGGVSDYPLTIRHRDGNLMDVLYNASLYRDTEGNVLGVFAAARDVTAQRQAEKVAQQRSKELVRLAELEQFQKLTVGRELKMIELKREIQDLKHRLGEGLDGHAVEELSDDAGLTDH